MGEGVKELKSFFKFFFKIFAFQDCSGKTPKARPNGLENKPNICLALLPHRHYSMVLNPKDFPDIAYKFSQEFSFGFVLGFVSSFSSFQVWTPKSDKSLMPRHLTNAKDCWIGTIDM